VRLGLFTPRGGQALLPRIRGICQEELGWNDARWEAEEAAYLALWQTHYSLPARARIPDWHAALARARLLRQAVKPSSRRSRMGTPVLAAVLTFFTLLLWKLGSRRLRPMAAT